MNSKFLNKYTRSLYTNVNKKLYIVCFVLIAIVLFWTIINIISGKNNESENQAQNKSMYKPAETVISGKDITASVYEEDENLVNKFVEYCNNGNVDEAYNLLSDDCKEIIFNNSQDNFVQNYYSEIFASKRECNLQGWVSENGYNTYRVRMIDDIMSTGNYSNSKNYQDYMTVVKDGENQYLNIKGFLKKRNINKGATETDEIDVSVSTEITYIDYVEYRFTVKNKTDKTILMDTMQNISNTMYLELSEGQKRSSSPEGLSIAELLIEKDMTKNISVKYNQSAGNTEDTTKKIYFKNIIKDYDAYKNDKNNYEDILELTIKM